ncbi:unnamed protein product [Rotaria sordida]|uniref:Uncharacterized protein n=1 Tax=Rotaria sordida TaxID=392033 RepID=A0A815Y1E5_9BILA|nr:unnamed protein product [Rotaria sordida]CAF1564394.1 unnamed protein product [Rotaria sordida]
MSGLFSCFQSKISQSSTAQEINILSLKTKLPPKDIQEWYLRFVHCYPYEYLSRQQFINYYQQLIDEHSIKIKGKTMSRDELKEFLRNMFDLFDIPSSKIHINQVINKIFQKNSLNKYDKIKWDQFVKEILNDETLFQQLISLDFNQDYSQHYSFIQTYQTF